MSIKVAKVEVPSLPSQSIADSYSEMTEEEQIMAAINQSMEDVKH